MAQVACVFGQYAINHGDKLAVGRTVVMRLD